MIKVPTLEQEARKFRKMNRSTSSAYRLAHAVWMNEAEPFNPNKMLSAMESTIDQHIADHVAAVNRLTSQVRTVHGKEPSGK